MLEDIPPEFLLPAGMSVAVVIVFVSFVFLFGAGRTRSYEEAKAQASREADAILKDQHSPKPKKKRSFGRRRGKGEEAEPPRLFSILKGGTKSDGPPERSPIRSVAFELDSTPKQTGRPAGLISPPTPYPSSSPPSFPSLPLEEVEEEEEAEREDVEREEGQLGRAKHVEREEEGAREKVAAHVASKPTAPSAARAAGKTASQKKAKSKNKSMDAFEGTEAMPASRISAVVDVSSLSDDDIQQLIEQLMGKLNANSEWQAAASLRPESVKTLKKLNLDIQSRCEEAEKTVLAHGAKIRGLRAEIEQERGRRQGLEAQFQAKATQHANELAIARSKVAGLEEELKQTQAMNSPDTVQLLREKSSSLETSVATAVAKQEALTQQLSSSADECRQLKEANADLLQANDALQHSETKRLQEQLAELEEETERLRTGNAQLESSLDASEKVCVQLRTDKEKASEAMAQLTLQLEEGQARAEEEKQKMTQLEEENHQLQDETQQLRDETQQLRDETKQLQDEVERLHCAASTPAVPEQQTANPDAAASTDTEAFQAQLIELQAELEELRGRTNGPVQQNGVGEGEGEVEGKTAALLEERDELAGQVKALEKKLDDLRNKNTELRENCWRARDGAAAMETACQARLKEANQDCEKRCKAVKMEVLEEASCSKQELLQRMFPEVVVSDGLEARPWVQEFEGKVLALKTSQTDKIASLEESVTSLELREKSTLADAEQFKTTLHATMEIMAQLQSVVDKENTVYCQNLEEKEEMIERERLSNRELQQHLARERAEVSSLAGSLQHTQGQLSASIHLVDQLRHDLEAAQHERELAQVETETLRHSLHHELEIKETTMDEIEDIVEQKEELEEKVKEEEDEIGAFAARNKELETVVVSLRQQLQEAMVEEGGGKEGEEEEEGGGQEGEGEERSGGQEQLEQLEQLEQKVEQGLQNEQLEQKVEQGLQVSIDLDQGDSEV